VQAPRRRLLAAGSNAYLADPITQGTGVCSLTFEAAGSPMTVVFAIGHPAFDGSPSEPQVESTQTPPNPPNVQVGSDGTLAPLGG